MTDWLGHYGGVASALAGLDMCMPGDGAVPLFGDSYWGPELSRSILNGSVPVSRLNDMVSALSGNFFEMHADTELGYSNRCYMVQTRPG